MSLRAYVSVLFVLLPILTGCPKKAPAADDAGATSDAAPTSSGSGSATPTAKTSPIAPRVATIKPFVPSFPVPPFKGAFPHVTDASVDEVGRAVEITFARAGDERDLAPLWTLTNKSGKAVRVNQTWLYYYDEKGKQDSRYPHSLGGFLTIEPGASVETRLGKKLKDIPAGTVEYEGEVTSAFFGDKPWLNENLIDRTTKGGFSQDELIAMTGERVVVEVYDIHGYKARLTNITDKPVSEIDATLFYYDAKGHREKRVSTHAKTPLKPGESLDTVLIPSFDSDKKPPSKGVNLLAFAPRVTFTDGTRFSNKNLDADAHEAPVRK